MKLIKYNSNVLEYAYLASQGFFKLTVEVGVEYIALSFSILKRW